MPRFRPLQLDRIGFAIVLTTAIAGLTHLSSFAQPPEFDDDFPSSPSSGMIVRSEITRILVPDRLAELAAQERHESTSQSAANIQRTLNTQGLADLWYIVTKNSQMANGQTMQLSFIRYPARHAEDFREFISDLALLAPGRAQGSSEAQPLISIQRIPDDTAKRDPHKVVDKLLQ